MKNVKRIGIMIAIAIVLTISTIVLANGVSYVNPTYPGTWKIGDWMRIYPSYVDGITTSEKRILSNGCCV